MTASIKIVIILQNIFILLCAFIFVWVIKKVTPKMVLLAALVMAIQVALPVLVVNGFSVLTEDIFSGLIILFSSFLFLAVGKNKPAWFIWTSTIAGLAYLTHPRALFLFAYYPFIVLYILFNRLPKRAIVYSAIPLLISLVIVPAYQYLFDSQIQHSPPRNLNFYYTYNFTAPYWETDPKFPSRVNEDIIRFHSSRSQQDVDILKNEWDGSKLYDLFFRTSQEVSQWGNAEGQNIYWTRYLDLNTEERDELGKQIVLKAITTHPVFYVKFIWASFSQFFSYWGWNPLGEFYQYYPTYLNEYYLPDGSLRLKDQDRFMRDYAQLPKFSALPVIRKNGQQQYDFIPSTSYRYNVQFLRFLGIIFSNNTWLTLFLLVWIISTIVTVASRFRNRIAFLLFIHGCLLFIMAVSIPLSLLSMSISRYSAPTQYFQYLLIFFSPLLFMKPGPDSQ